MRARIRACRVCSKCGGAKAPYAAFCMKCRLPTKHGLSYASEYRSWQTMRLRCTVPENPAYEDYGARGITVCASWLGSVAAFVQDMGPKPAGHELDRRDNNGGYWCGKCQGCLALGRLANCRWVTRSENDRNRRNNTLIEYKGERRVLTELSETFRIPADTLQWRIKTGWDLERALTTPVRAKKSARQSRAA